MKGTLVACVLAMLLLGSAKGDDIPDGKLGHRLGTYLVIEGIRGEEGKGGGGRGLLVDKVNGKKIEPPMCIWVENLDLPKGTRCVLRGYESGKMIGVPFEVAKKEGLALPQAGWQFFRFFIVTSVAEPESLKTELKKTNRQ